MQLMFSTELIPLLRDISIQNDGMPLSVFEPPQRFSRYSPAINFYNSVAWPPPDSDEGQTFCAMIQKSKVIDSTCLECDKNTTDHCVNTGKKRIYRCHRGFREAIIPIKINHALCACIFLGQVSTEPKSEDHFRTLYEELAKIDREFFTKDRYAEYYNHYNNRLCAISEKRFLAVCSMLEQLGESFVRLGWIRDVKVGHQELLEQYLSQHLYERISAEKVCRSLNISRATLYRLVKKEFGVGFNTYVNQHKIGVAKDLLKRGYNVKQTALMLGYEDVGYFSRLFSEFHNVSPSEFLRLHEKTNLSEKQ
ncbi:MAG: helix-turn-helix domain-containing protein [Clostridiales bacterium]|nr:helix-turn-helix domain-containing protein [Clostridiales bacterium]